MFTLTIETDNAAFEFAPGAEVARILRTLADHIDPDQREETGRVRDANGNTVGNWKLTQAD